MVYHGLGLVLLALEGLEFSEDLGRRVVGVLQSIETGTSLAIGREAGGARLLVQSETNHKTSCLAVEWQLQHLYGEHFSRAGVPGEESPTWTESCWQNKCPPPECSTRDSNCGTSTFWPNRSEWGLDTQQTNNKRILTTK